MKLSKIAALLLAVALVLSLAACGSGEKGSAAPDKGEKKITFWSVFTGGDGTAMQKIVDAYNATNPEYTVEHLMIEQGNLYQQLPLVVNSQEGVPDVIIQHVDRIPSNAAANMYLPLDEYIAANGKIKAENYIDSAWNMGAVDGVRYGIPLDMHSYVTYYNKELVDKYCPNVLDDGMVTFDEIASFADTAAADGDMPNNLFAQGKLIFLPEGTWTLSTVQYTKMDFGETYMITYDPENMVQWASSHQFVLPRNDAMTDEKAAAIMDFINFVGENSYEWAAYGQIPAHKAVLNDSRLNDLPQKFLIDNPDALVLSDYIYYGTVMDAIDTVSYEIPFGRVSAQEGLASAEQLVKDNIRNQ